MHNNPAIAQNQGPKSLAFESRKSRLSFLNKKTMRYTDERKGGLCDAVLGLACHAKEGTGDHRMCAWAIGTKWARGCTRDHSMCAWDIGTKWARGILFWQVRVVQGVPSLKRKVCSGAPTSARALCSLVHGLMFACSFVSAQR